jgi:hypothetical protein
MKVDVVDLDQKVTKSLLRSYLIFIVEIDRLNYRYCSSYTICMLMVIIITTNLDAVQSGLVLDMLPNQWRHRILLLKSYQISSRWRINHAYMHQIKEMF